MLQMVPETQLQTGGVNVVTHIHAPVHMHDPPCNQSHLQALHMCTGQSLKAAMWHVCHYMPDPPVCPEGAALTDIPPL